MLGVASAKVAAGVLAGKLVVDPLCCRDPFLPAASWLWQPLYGALPRKHLPTFPNKRSNSFKVNAARAMANRKCRASISASAMGC